MEMHLVSLPVMLRGSMLSPQVCATNAAGLSFVRCKRAHACRLAFLSVPFLQSRGLPP